MKRMKKIGGIAALYEAAAYVIGILFFMIVVDYTSIVDPLERIAALAENSAGIYLVTLLIYIVFAFFLVILSLELYRRLKDNAPDLMKIALAFGLIWACVLMAGGMIFNIGMETVVELADQDPSRAATVWIAIESVFNGLGGGNEIVGGIWIFLISVAGLREGGFPRLVNYLGFLVGAAGAASAIPLLGEIGGMVFGLGQIIWFVWIGILMVADGNPKKSIDPGK
jgi:hypothetical protein